MLGGAKFDVNMSVIFHIMHIASFNNFLLSLCRRLCCDHEQVRGDIICLGKALSGGMLPVSYISSTDG